MAQLYLYFTADELTQIRQIISSAGCPKLYLPLKTTQDKKSILEYIRWSKNTIKPLEKLVEKMLKENDCCVYEDVKGVKKAQPKIKYMQSLDQFSKKIAIKPSAKAEELQRINQVLLSTLSKLRQQPTPNMINKLTNDVKSSCLARQDQENLIMVISAFEKISVGNGPVLLKCEIPGEVKDYLDVASSQKKFSHDIQREFKSLSPQFQDLLNPLNNEILRMREVTDQFISIMKDQGTKFRVVSKSGQYKQMNILKQASIDEIVQKAYKLEQTNEVIEALVWKISKFIRHENGIQFSPQEILQNIHNLPQKFQSGFKTIYEHIFSIQKEEMISPKKDPRFGIKKGRDPLGVKKSSSESSISEEKKDMVQIDRLKSYIEIASSTKSYDDQINSEFEKLSPKYQTLMKPLNQELIRIRGIISEYFSLLKDEQKKVTVARIRQETSVIVKVKQQTVDEIAQRLYKSQDALQKISNFAQALSSSNDFLQNRIIPDRKQLLPLIKNLPEKMRPSFRKIYDLVFSAENRQIIVPEREFQRNDDQIRKLESQKRELQNRLLKLPECQKKITELENEITNLLTLNQSLDQQVSTKQNTIDLLQKQKSPTKTRSQTSQLQNQIQIANQNLESVRVEKRQAEDKYIKERNELLNTIQRLQNEVSSLQEKPKQISFKKLMAQQFASQPKSQKNIQVKEGADSKLNSELYLLKNQNQSLRRENQILSIENSKIKCEIAKISLQNSSIKNQGLNRDSVIHSMTQNQSKLQLSLAKIREVNSSIVNEIKQIQKELPELKKKSDAYDSIILQFEERGFRIETLTQNLEKVKEAYSRISNQEKVVDTLGKSSKISRRDPDSPSNPEYQDQVRRKEKKQLQQIEIWQKKSEEKDQEIVNLQIKIKGLERELTNSDFLTMKSKLSNLEEKQKEKTNQIHELKIQLEKKEQEILRANCSPRKV